jgi:drug/metabolite transporter (DMT)-like permease
MNPDTRVKGVIFASITAFFWGFLAIALKVASGIMDPLTIVWFRFLVAFTALLLYFSITKPQSLKILINPPLYIILASLGLGINYIGFLYGLKLTTPGTAQIVIQVGPIFLGVVGLVFFKEKISRRQAFGFLLAGLGFFIFYREGISKMVGNQEIFQMGVLWIVVAAMAWVVYATFQKMLLKSYPAMQLNLFLFGLPVILFLPFTNLSDFAHLSPGNWGLMFYLGLNTLIAYGSLAMAFKYLEANKISIIVTLNPIITFVLIAILAWFEVSWIEPEKLTLTGIFGALLVVAGAITAVAFAKPSTKREITEFVQKNRGK